MAGNCVVGGLNFIESVQMFAPWTVGRSTVVVSCIWTFGVGARGKTSFYKHVCRLWMCRESMLTEWMKFCRSAFLGDLCRLSI